MNNTKIDFNFEIKPRGTLEYLYKVDFHLAIEYPERYVQSLETNYSNFVTSVILAGALLGKKSFLQIGINELPWKEDDGIFIPSRYYDYVSVKEGIRRILFNPLIPDMKGTFSENNPDIVLQTCQNFVFRFDNPPSLFIVPLIKRKSTFKKGFLIGGSKRLLNELKNFIGDSLPSLEEGFIEVLSSCNIYREENLNEGERA